MGNETKRQKSRREFAEWLAKIAPKKSGKQYTLMATSKNRRIDKSKGRTSRPGGDHG